MTRHTLNRLILAVLLSGSAALLYGCGGGDNRPPVPRRHAYPRMAVPDSVQLDTVVAGRRIRAAVHGRPTVPQSDWLNLDYPGATLHIAFNSVASDRMAAELDNRRQRMSLNLGGAPARTAHFTTADSVYECVLVTAEVPVLTPIQLLGTDGRSRLVYAALRLHTAPAPNAIDSLTPMLQLVTADLHKVLE